MRKCNDFCGVCKKKIGRFQKEMLYLWITKKGCNYDQTIIITDI